MAEQDNYFIAQAQQYAPLSNGQPAQFLSGLEGLPGIDTNPILGMAIQPMLSKLMGMTGMAPMGMNDRNIYDTLQSQRFWGQQAGLQQQMAKLDGENVSNTMRGIATAHGTPWGAEQMRAAHAIGDMASSAAPLLSMLAPDLLDQFGGQRGSASVMASQMMQAGRYRIDPLTGMQGMDAKSMARQATDMFKQFYGGDKIDLEQTQGFRAGEMGHAYNQMTMRGMMPGSGGPRSILGQLAGEGEQNQNLIRQAARSQGVDLSKVTGKDGRIDTSGISSADIQKLTQDSGLSEKMQSVDSSKISATIKGYLKTLNAVKDIFGEMGQPNAPMAQLISAMDAMTNGGSSQLSPGKMGTMIRMTQQMANAAGTDVNTAMMLQQHASQLGGEFGLDATNAIGVTQGSLGFMGAMKGQGVAAAWGKSSMDQLTQKDMMLRTRGSASQSANRMAYALSVADAAGGFQEGSDAASFAQALRSGQDLYKGKDGQMHSVGETVHDNTSFFALMKGARDTRGTSLGLDTNDIVAGSAGSHELQEYIVKHNLGDRARNSQYETDARPDAIRTNKGFLRSMLLKKGATGADVDQVNDRTAAAVEAAMHNMSNDDFADKSKVEAVMSDAMQKSLAGSDALAAMHMSPEQQKAYFAQQAAALYTQKDTNQRALTGMGLQDQHTLQSDQLLSAGSATQKQQLLVAQVHDELAPLNRGTARSKAMGFIQGITDNKDQDVVMRGIATAFGGVDIETIKSKVMPAAMELDQKQKELAQMQEDFKTVKPEDQAAWHKKYNTGVDALHGIATRLHEAFDSLGGGKDEGVSDRDTQRAMNWSSRADTFAAQMRDPAFAGNPDNQKLYAEAVGQQMESAETVAAKATMSNAAAHNLGTRGLKESDAIRGANQQIRELALKYSGGDVGDLLAGKYQGNLTADEKMAIGNQVKQLGSDRGAAVSDIDRMVNAGGRQWDPKELADDLNAAGQSVKLEDVQRAKSLNDNDLTVLGTAAKAQEAVDRDRGADGKGTVLAADQKALDDANVAAGAVMKRTGIGSMTDAQAAAGVYKKIEAAADPARSKSNLGTTDRAKALLKSFGIDADASDPELAVLAEKAGSEVGTAFFDSVTAGENKLIEIGQRGAKSGKHTKAELDAIASREKSTFAADVTQDYQAVKGSKDPAAAAKAFRAKYGLQDDKDYKDFQKIEDLQEKTGFVAFGAGGHGITSRRKSGISDASGMMDAAIHGAKQAAPVVNVTYPNKIDVTLTDGGVTRTGTAKVSNSGDNSSGANFPPTGGK